MGLEATAAGLFSSYRVTARVPMIRLLTELTTTVPCRLNPAVIRETVRKAMTMSGTAARVAMPFRRMAELVT